jgi:hypothetical protein
VAGDLLHHVQRHPTAHAVRGQGAAEAVGAHPLQTQALAGLAQGFISSLAGLGAVCAAAVALKSVSWQALEEIRGPNTPQNRKPKKDPGHQLQPACNRLATFSVTVI